MFGRFDSFCARVLKILTMFDLIDDYQKLFERRMEGLLLGEGLIIFYLSYSRCRIFMTITLSSVALEEATKSFEEAKKIATSKSYDYLDPRNVEFDRDYDTFMAKTDSLKDSIGEIIEKNYADVWETPQGIRFLTRFEKVQSIFPQRLRIYFINYSQVSEKIPLTKLEEKYQLVVKYCDKEVERTLKLFKKQRDDPPLPRHMPPIAGRLTWAHSLK